MEHAARAAGHPLVRTSSGLNAHAPKHASFQTQYGDDNMQMLNAPRIPVKRFFLAACVALLPLLVGCASGTANSSTPAGSSTQALTIKAQDSLKFDPTTLSAKAGQPIQLTLDSSGAGLVHDFSITEGVSQPIAITSQPGQKATGTFTIDKPGTYPYFCSQPGHAQAGMKGTLTVQ